MSAAVCLIPARGGSKGLRDKNLRTVGGISLVARAVLAAREFGRLVGLRDLPVVVDTDSAAIAEEGRAWGARVPFLRPAELAGDEMPTATSSLAALERLEQGGGSIEHVILLQPTSPLRTGADVLECWRAYDPAGAPSVVSVTPDEHGPEIALRVDADGRVQWRSGEPAARRQDHGLSYRPSGAVYVISHDLLRRERKFIVAGVTRGVILPPERSVDVDTASDLAEAEARLAAGGTRSIEVAGRTIGDGHPCFVIAEAGVNHNGDSALAHQLIDVAADAGADAVKFQTFDPERLVSATARKAAYQAAGTGSSESQLDMLRRLVLPLEALAALAEHAARRGLIFLSTPFDESSADTLGELGMAAFKVPSGEVTNHALVAHVAGKGRPVLLSTGMSTLAEVAAAVEVVRQSGHPPLALFHCVTSYPAAPADCNLRAIAAMKAAFGAPVGWSDHTEGVAVSLAAVAAGANLLEKHFTLDRGLPGPDHRASLEPGRAGPSGPHGARDRVGDGRRHQAPGGGGAGERGRGAAKPARLARAARGPRDRVRRPGRAASRQRPPAFRPTAAGGPPGTCRGGPGGNARRGSH